MPKPKKKQPSNSIETIEEKIEVPVKKVVRFLRIDDDRQRKVREEIKSHAEPGVTFFLLTLFSTIIIALGLIIDNAAVVIGGMIIAPLFWPILALGWSIIKGNSRSVKKNFFTILKASFIIVLVSFLIGLVSPYLGESHELLLRTKPTLFELFIALAAGFVGAFAVAHPKLSANLAGVVAAVALVPPLAVMGILFAQGEFILATGAALLYFTNFIAITFAAVMLFLSVGVKFPRSLSGKNTAASSISWFVIFLILAAIPLTLVMRDIIIENTQRNTIHDVITEYIIDSNVTELSVTDVQDEIVIDATVRSPYDVKLLHVRRLSDILTEQLGMPVDLTINVVPTYTAGEGSQR